MRRHNGKGATVVNASNVNERVMEQVGVAIVGDGKELEKAASLELGFSG